MFIYASFVFNALFTTSRRNLVLECKCLSLMPGPHPHSNVQGGRMRIPIFSEQGVIFGRLSLEDFPEKNLKSGRVLNQTPKMWGCLEKMHSHISRAQRKEKKRSGIGVTVMFPR